MATMKKHKERSAYSYKRKKAEKQTGFYILRKNIKK